MNNKGGVNWLNSGEPEIPEKGISKLSIPDSFYKGFRHCDPETLNQQKTFIFDDSGVVFSEITKIIRTPHVI